MKWISCEKRKPKAETLVLIKTDRNEVTIGYRWLDYEAIEEDGINYPEEWSWEIIPLPVFGRVGWLEWGGEPGVKTDAEITHWMPMPKP